MPTGMFTGHRPDKLDGWDVFDGPRTRWVTHELVRIIEKFQVKYDYDLSMITGGACGVDMIGGVTCRILRAPYDLYAPCHNQEARWSQEYQKTYRTLKADARSVHYTYEGNYPGAWVMQRRNIEMADACDFAIAVYDGSTSGGTYNAVEYLEGIGRPIVYIDPAGVRPTHIVREPLLPKP